MSGQVPNFILFAFKCIHIKLRYRPRRLILQSEIVTVRAFYTREEECILRTS